MMGRPATVTSLTKRVEHLSNVCREAEKLIELQKQEIDTLRHEAITLKRKRQESSDEAVKAYSDLGKAIAQRDALHNERDALLERALRVEASLKEAQTHAEMMRQQAFPTGPTFPWENEGEVTVTRVGDVHFGRLPKL
jgi:uncharacterized coiled-coil DUF342 family protein